jgi:hypothetical protein
MFEQVGAFSDEGAGFAWNAEGEANQLEKIFPLP